MDNKAFLSMEGISKSFFGVHVLNDVSLSVQQGEVHALVGENGAGKSTLMKILAGLYTADEGRILLDGSPVSIRTPKEGIQNGISFIHQELSMVPDMSIMQNFYLGEELCRGKVLDNRAMWKRTSTVLQEFGLKLHPDLTVDILSVAQQQMVEICRAISFNARVIIMDEPTASLSGGEVASLFEQIRRLKKEKVTIIFISHKLEELMDICDNVTVLRDGQLIATRPISEITQDELISLMVGRKIEQMFEQRGNSASEVVFEARNLSNRHLHDVSFTLKKGEVLGVSGLVGAGRTELAHAIFGIDRLSRGEMYLNGRRIVHHRPGDAIKNGFALVPEDRKQNGLVLIQDVRFNLTLCVIRKIRSFFRVFKKRERELLDRYANAMSIKMSGHDQVCMSLSGGNQQKVVLSKWMATEPAIMILDEPTRGIDVGAKSEIYHIIHNLSEAGISVIMISSELPEIINLSHRVLVMHEGHPMKIIDADTPEFNQENIMHYATGGIPT